MSASAVPLDTWQKVHGELLETMLHRCVLQIESSGGSSGETAPTADLVAHGERMRVLAAELVDLGAPAPLDQLEAIAALAPVERELVGLLLASELDPAVGRALADRFGVPMPTPAIAAELFDLSATEAAALLAPTAPLRRFALVSDSPSGPPVADRPIRLADRTLHHLCGHGALDERLHGVLDEIEPVALTERLVELAHRLRDWLAVEGGGRPSRVALVGRPGAGRGAVAAHVASDFGMRLFAVDLERLAGRADRLDLARAITRELLLTPAALYVDVDQPSSDDPARAATIDETLDVVGGLVFVGTTRPDAAHSGISVEIPPLELYERVELWRRAFDGLVASEHRPDAELFGDQYRYGPRGIARVAAAAAARSALEGRWLDDDVVRAVSGAATAASLASLAQRVGGEVGWDRLVVGDDERRLLRALCDHVRHRTRVHDDWGVGRGSMRGLGTSALFTGPSGTGKTLAAEVVATELRLPLYRIDLASVVSKYIGETEKNLRKVFDAAESGGAILFFDEADALFGKRTEVKDSHDRYANIEIDYLLQRMEDHAGLSILATNRKSDIDQAFLRRVRFVVPFPFPREDARRAIWATELAVGIPTRAVDVDALAKLELAGGNIRNVVVNAAFAAAADDAEVTMTHLLRAARQEYVKIDKLPTRAEFGAYYDEVFR